MKVWFGCTSHKFAEYKENYYAIRNYLKEELGCIILFDWLEDAENELINGNGKRDIKKIYESVIKAIDEADACVIEYTIPNFSSSHQINYSLFKRKPTLVIRQTKDNADFTGSYLEAIDSDKLIVKDYDNTNLKKILNEFIGYSKLEAGQQRYNIVLDKKQKYYLDWASNKYKKSRSLMIRDAVNKLIEDDPDYKKYLGIG